MNSAEKITSGIYLIRNVVSGLSYIGQSSDIKARWHQHRYCCRQEVYRRGNKLLWKSWRKHGEQAFEFVVLEECGVDLLTKREAYWLNEFRVIHGIRVANFDGPSDNNMRGRRHSQETLAKMSQAAKNQVRTESHRRKIGESLRGRVVSESAKAAMAAAAKGKSRPNQCGAGNVMSRPEVRALIIGDNNPARRPDVRAKLSLAASKPVRDATTGEQWGTQGLCAAALGVSQAALSAHLLGKSRTCRGRVFEFVEPAC